MIPVKFQGAVEAFPQLFELYWMTGTQEVGCSDSVEAISDTAAGLPQESGMVCTLDHSHVEDRKGRFEQVDMEIGPD